MPRLRSSSDRPAWRSFSPLTLGMIVAALTMGWADGRLSATVPAKPSAAATTSAAVAPLLGLHADFSDGRLSAWRHKENSQLQVVADGPKKVLRLGSRFAPFDFTWATWSFPPHTAQGVTHLRFRLFGDGSGHLLRVQLGGQGNNADRPHYYVNTDQSPKLDFTGWRTVTLDLDHFQTPSNALRQADLAAVVFVEFMVVAQAAPAGAAAKSPSVDVRLADVEFIGPTPEELALLQQQSARRQELRHATQPRLAVVEAQLAGLRAQLDRLAQQKKYVDVARVYVAALQWCLADVRRCLESDEPAVFQQGLALLADLAGRAGQTAPVISRVGDRAPDEPDVLDVQHNPYFKGCADVVRAQSRKERTWPKGRQGYESITDAWQFRTLGDSVYETLWVVTRPHSPLRHHPVAVANALNLFDTIAHQHSSGDFNVGRTAVFGRDGNINRFCLAPTLDAWLLLKAAYPDLLPPAKQAEIEAGLKVLADYQVTEYGTARQAQEPHVKFPTYLNMDVHHILIMEFARRLWGPTPYAAERDAFLRGVESAVYPDGAWPYINSQNECFTYHQLDVAFLARYWQLSRDPAVLATLRKTVPFYPDNVEPAGMPEYYTDPCWKHYWAGGSPQGPEIIAGLFDDGPNKRVAETAAGVGGYGHGYHSAIAAEFFKPLAAAPPADSYVRYDRNIEGPRGRYGAWSFAGNGRDYHVGYQGKDTFVGAMITAPAARPTPLDSALQLVTAEIRTRSDGNHWTGAECFSAAEKLSTALGKDFGSLAVRYTVSRPNWHHKSDDLRPWDGVQEWYLSKNRLIGRVGLEATADDTRVAVLGRVRLGMGLTIEPDGENGWKYGRLRIRLHDHNYARIEIRPSETFFQDKPDRYRSTEITLIDPLSAKAGGPTAVKYPKGSRYWFLVEVYPDDAQPAEDVGPWDQGGATGFSFREAGRRITVLHNPTDQTAKVTLPLFGSTREFDIYSNHDGRAEKLSIPPPESTPPAAAGADPRSIRLSSTTVRTWLKPQQHLLVVGGM